MFLCHQHSFPFPAADFSPPSLKKKAWPQTEPREKRCSSICCHTNFTRQAQRLPRWRLRFYQSKIADFGLCMSENLMKFVWRIQFIIGQIEKQQKNDRKNFSDVFSVRNLKTIRSLCNEDPVCLCPRVKTVNSPSTFSLLPCRYLPWKLETFNERI